MTNENKTTHSPLPWRVDGNGEGHKTIIRDARGLIVASSWVVHIPGETYGNQAETDANAALIVEAVNQHENLLRIIGELLPIARTEFCRLTEVMFSILRTHPNNKELIGEIGDVAEDMIRLFDEADAVIKNEVVK